MQENHLKKISLVCSVVGLIFLFAVSLFFDPPKVQSGIEGFRDQKVSSSGKVLSQRDMGNVTYITANICEDRQIVLFRNSENFKDRNIEIRGTVEDDRILADEVRII